MDSAKPQKLPSPVTAFDSSTVPLQMLASYLEGRDHQLFGGSPMGAAILSAMSHLVPPGMREHIYQLGGRKEAVSREELNAFDAEAAAQAIVDLYPPRRYPAIAIGSSNGAATHLCAALGIPWLPQNLLILAKGSELDPDQPRDILEKGRAIAEPLLANNPELTLHHMVDPSQDRLMSREALYFRVKRLRLGAAYERFIAERLAPGGTLLSIECGLKWPVKRVNERHVFQLGGVGGLEPREYVDGSPRVAAFLEAQGASLRSWDPAPPDEEQPEAEWGFAESLAGDMARFAEERGYGLRRVRFETPEDLSPFVANLYRWWYRKVGCGLDPERLIIESFFLIDPWHVLETASVPFWTVFNAESSARAVERYLDLSGGFDDIRAVVFSHGIESPGLAPMSLWLSLLGRARFDSGLLGVDPQQYPKDFQVFLRYHNALRRLPGRPHPAKPLTLRDLDAFLSSEPPVSVRID
jgi:hypothetical protein